MSAFTNRIDDILFEKNLSRSDMYKAIPEITHQRFYNWINLDQTPPSTNLMIKLATFLDTTVEFLVNGIQTHKVYTSDDLIEVQKDKLQKIIELSDLSTIY